MKPSHYLRSTGRAVTQAASISYCDAENDDGHWTPAVYAKCRKSGYEIGPIWGQHEKSVKRALATLTVFCPCEAHFHEED